VHVIPASHFFIKSMVFAADRAPYAHNPTGFVPQFHGDPMSVQRSAIALAGGHPAVRAQDNVEARKGYAGLYRFGGAYHPGMFASTSSNKPVSGNYLIYGMASQALYRTRPDTDRGIDPTIGADWTPPDRSRNNQDLTVGLRLNEPMPVPFHHTIGIA
jgi:porin